MSMRIYQEYRKRLKRFGEWDNGQNDLASYKRRKEESKNAPKNIPIEEWTNEHLIYMRNKNKEHARRCVYGMQHRKSQCVLTFFTMPFMDR